MFRLAAVIAFAFSVVFNAWSLGHSPWTWQLFMLIGLLCMAIAGKWEV